MSKPTTPPTATWNPARGVWETSQTNLFCEHWVPYSETWPTSGMTRSGAVYPLPPWVPLTSDSECSSSPTTLLPTPTASDRFGTGVHGEGGPDLRTTISLLPRPRATDGSKGGPNQRGSSGDLMLPSAVAKLLPTPQAHDGRPSSPVLPSVATAALRMAQGKSNLEDSIALLPTPTARDWKGENQRRDTSCLPGALLPTPAAADCDRSSLTYVRGNPTLLGAVSTGVSTPLRSNAGNEPSDVLPLFPVSPDPEVA
jgi:hypothetical protein